MVYKWYILPIGGLYATYHLLGEPETTIEFTSTKPFSDKPPKELATLPRDDAAGDIQHLAAVQLRRLRRFQDWMDGWMFFFNTNTNLDG